MNTWSRVERANQSFISSGLLSIPEPRIWIYDMLHFLPFFFFFFSCSMWTRSYSMWFPSFLTKNDLVFWLRMGPGPPALGVLATRPGKSLIHLLLKQLFICKNFLLQFGCLFSVHVLFLIFSVTAWFWYYWSVFLKCTIFDCPSFSSFFCIQKLFS